MPLHSTGYNAVVSQFCVIPLLRERGMRMNVERWPSWLRWCLFIPAALIAPTLYSIVERVVVPRFVEEGLLFETFDGFMWGTIFVAAGAWVSPARRMTAFILGGFLVLLCGFNLASVWLNPYGFSSPPGAIILSSLASIAGGGHAAWHFVTARESDLQEPSAFD